MYTEHIDIPSLHWGNVRKEYADHGTALIREFLQNSVDAGAKNVHFNFTDKGLTAFDDGSGMDEETLKKGLLTLSGSVKVEGAAGGFGQAKMLLIIQHESYTVKTKNLLVEGKHLRYNIDRNVANYNGTEISVVFGDGFFDTDYSCYSLGSLKAKAKKQIGCCFLPGVNVFIDGVQIHTLTEPGEVVRVCLDPDGIPWAHLKSKSIYPAQTSFVSVQVNGIHMFHKILMEQNYYQYVLDIKIPSTQILTTNRDGLKSSFESQLDKIIQEIATENISFGALYGRSIIYGGDNRHFNFDLKTLVESINSAKLILDEFDKTEDSRDNLNLEEISTQSIILFQEALIKEALQNKTQIDPDHPAVLAFNATIKEYIQGEGKVIQPQVLKAIAEDCYKRIRGLDTDFIIRCDQTMVDAIPDELIPGNLTGRLLRIAKLWKYCIRLALEHRTEKTNISYRVGWILSDSIEACIETKGDVRTFLLNPSLIILQKGNRNTFTKILISACHEVAHILQPYHGELFIHELQHLIQSVFTNQYSWWHHYISAGEETI